MTEKHITKRTTHTMKPVLCAVALQEERGKTRIRCTPMGERVLSVKNVGKRKHPGTVLVARILLLIPGLLLKKNAIGVTHQLK